MSEIKGQLLGIILVLAIFGIVGAALKSAFTNMKDTVVEEVETVSSSLGNTLTYNS